MSAFLAYGVRSGAGVGCGMDCRTSATSDFVAYVLEAVVAGRAASAFADTMSIRDDSAESAEVISDLVA